LYIQPLFLSKSLYRSLKLLASAVIVPSLLVVCAGAQNNPVPQVVGPPHPQAVTPSGAAFVLKVYGANFVPDAVVNWNRQPRATTYVSGHEVDATILASDIASNTAGYITVTNPPPGGGVSSASWTLVEVHEPTATIAPPAKPAFYGYAFQGEIPELLVADFNNDGIMDLADFDAIGTIPIYLGAANGTFTYSDLASSLYWPIFSFNNATYGDFNGDGNVDLAYDSYLNRSSSTGLDVSLGDGNGRFTPGWKEDQIAVANVLAGDFNRDGNLDLIAGYSSYTYVYLGNGDGTFTLSQTFNFGPTAIRLAGDFNGDGNLDLVLLADAQPTTISVALGNGDGTFQTPRTVATFDGECASGGPVMLVTDFNGDGKLDVAFCTSTSIGVMRGNGDGTFQKPVFYSVDAQPQFSFTAGDFNSDGETDLLVSKQYPTKNDGIEIRLGNGDGTFQRPQYFADNTAYYSGECGIAVGDFNSDGLLDFVFQNGGDGFDVYLQAEQ
jgi:hypothetical protein